MSDLLKEGDVINLVEGHKVYADVPKHFLGTDGDFTLQNTDVHIKGNFLYLAGKYLVTKTSFGGGSTGHDSYPDGHKVTCRKIDNKIIKGPEVRFYQSGSFTAMIKDITPIGRAEQQWVIK